MITIVLMVSRNEYLAEVLTSLELMECEPEEVNILCIVDGDDDLFLTTRNRINGMKFNERLVVRSEVGELPTRLDVQKRRKHIAALHNQAGKLIGENVEWVLSVEDDTTFGRKALTKLFAVTRDYPALGFVEGVELGRWGVPYVGGWRVDDIYDTNKIVSVTRPDMTLDKLKIKRLPNESWEADMATEERLTFNGVEPIDAGGLYCALIRADLYKNHHFNSDNGLGPDVNFGIELRQTGHENFIHWGVPCKHYNYTMGKQQIITPDQETKQVTITKKSDKNWIITY